MTALPRSPADVPVNPLHAQTTASGRQSPSKHPLSPASSGEEGAPVKFSNVLGELKGQAGAPINQKTGHANGGHVTEGSGVVIDGFAQKTAHQETESDLNTTSNISNNELIDSQAQHSALTSTGFGDGSNQVTRDAKPEGMTAAVPISPAGSTEGKARNPEIAQHVQLPSQGDATALDADGRLIRGEAAELISPTSLDVNAKMRSQAQPAPAIVVRAAEGVPVSNPRATGSTARPDVGGAVGDAPNVPSEPLADSSAMNLAEKPRLEMVQRGEQVKPAATPLETINAVSSTPSNTINSQAAVPNQSIANTEGSSDLPRLQDVKVTATRTFDIPPLTADRTGQGSTVKVIDLQLQPDTLGRIGAQIKQTGGVLEVRLEPTMAETATLLKEDRLALQRILGSIGSLSEAAVVRIIDPVAEYKLEDGQDVLADVESDEPNLSGGQSALSGGLRDEDYGREHFAQGPGTTDQSPMDVGPQRASGDIYI